MNVSLHRGTLALPQSKNNHSYDGFGVPLFEQHPHGKKGSTAILSFTSRFTEFGLNNPNVSYLRFHVCNNFQEIDCKIKEQSIGNAWI